MILIGNAIDMLKSMDSQSVHCCVTSPPYFGLRDYGIDGQIGMEESPDVYADSLVNVFREVKRVLRDDGTLWLNLGDSYNGSGAKSVQVNSPKQMTSRGATSQKGTFVDGLKPKDLIELVPTNIVEGRQARVHRMSPSPERWKERSRTLQGIADAMALQWSVL